MATTGTITVHSPGLCAQLLDTGTTQRVDLPAGKDKEIDKVSKPTLFLEFAHPFNILKQFCTSHQSEMLDNALLLIWI